MGLTRSYDVRDYLIRFYVEQLNKFETIGIGNDTEFGVKITQAVIDKTQERLWEIKCSSIKVQLNKERDIYKRGTKDLDRIEKNLISIELSIMKLKEEIGLV